MRSFKLLTLIILASATLLSACHTSKRSKNAYLVKFYKELKKEMPDGKVKRKADTVRVIYPELAMFDFGKDQVKAEAMPSLKSFATVLKKYDRVYFHINGYTDNVGPSDVNVSLSQRRAENAKTLMEGNGVGAMRMTTNGKGEADPIMTNTTDEGRQANRRVEFVLYDTKPGKK